MDPESDPLTESALPEEGTFSKDETLSIVSSEKIPIYRDMSTWTVEDDVPSPMDSSTPIDSPDFGQLRKFKPYRHHNNSPHKSHSKKHESEKNRHHEAKKSSNKVPFTTISSQLLSREAKLYENLPEGSDFLSVSDFLGSKNTSSPASWADSGRESLSFDNEPPPQSKNRKKGGRLVRQKHSMHEDLSPTGINSMCSYLAVPSPRRSLLQNNSGLLYPNSGNSSSGPVQSPVLGLSRHPPPSHLGLVENKRSRGLIPGAESPYAFSTSERSSERERGERERSRTDGTSFHDYNQSRLLRLARSPSRGLGLPSSSSGRFTSNCGNSVFSTRGKNESFDYGELPSHQMFPKRHLLGGRQFSQPYTPIVNNANPNGGNSAVAPQPHRSFPSGAVNGVGGRSCSLGDLSSGGACGSLNSKSHLLTTPQPQEPLGNSSLSPNSGGPLGGASLPLHPHPTSVTYEFSLAPVSGTLAPGWHLTAVQRGLATAVPLAAVVARRRLPRPRPIRPRFGFTDKNEARKAKWTIAVTALALLAMSMLLVGITLRLAPLIDDLVRKENEDLLRVQTPSTLNVTQSLEENLNNNVYKRSNESPNSLDKSNSLNFDKIPNQSIIGTNSAPISSSEEESPKTALKEPLNLKETSTLKPPLKMHIIKNPSFSTSTTLATQTSTSLDSTKKIRSSTMSSSLFSHLKNSERDSSTEPMSAESIVYKKLIEGSYFEPPKIPEES